jgi:hypothetical protein
MNEAAPDTQWLDELDCNEFGTKILTYARARSMAAGGAQCGWYVAPFATKWTVGRMASREARFHILMEDQEPLTFETIWSAKTFLSKLLGPSVRPAILWRRFMQPLAGEDPDVRQPPLPRPERAEAAAQPGSRPARRS